MVDWPEWKMGNPSSPSSPSEPQAPRSKGWAGAGKLGNVERGSCGEAKLPLAWLGEARDSERGVFESRFPGMILIGLVWLHISIQKTTRRVKDWIQGTLELQHTPVQTTSGLSRGNFRKETVKRM
ncbi:hypothetical protein B0H65DRAFT_445935 [Neurospora tetraspora]|uniref:Uncharacterized protein n=1 Tax=Neurospora tetraspora TaxID=94610 RepID=A0AAE0J6W8_9PEZI|nr:hypothetical protein B0H65DRAFT_445935 [Neurospora tetraspora]